jgi:4,5-DOPA dioxygenase extradiol
VLFIGHGSPMNAIEDNRWSRAQRALGAALPRPEAILCVSAHAYGPASFVTAEEHPRTVHDFGGFPQELFDVEYPVAGAPGLARRVCALLGDDAVRESTDQGLDHGTWSVLRHLFPAADVPVAQLALDARLTAAQHLGRGRALAPLAEEGVLVVGSGNLVHNLRDHFARALTDDEPPAWVLRFDADVARALEQRDVDFLTRALDGAAGRAAHPTPEHYLPLLYAFGAAGERFELSYPIEGFDGLLSMRSVRFDPPVGP